jgi:hypothetical protein
MQRALRSGFAIRQRATIFEYFLRQRKCSTAGGAKAQKRHRFKACT